MRASATTTVLMTAVLVAGSDADADAQEPVTAASAAAALVAVYGYPGHPRLGALGGGTPLHVGRRLAVLTRRHSTAQRSAKPTFDLVATLATRHPGRDGRHRRRLSAVRIAPYVTEARKRDGVVLLDLSVACRRLTVASPELLERLTCDVALELGGARLDPGYAIVESKSARGDATADRLLLELGVRHLGRCSKYCLGMALERPEVRANHFRPIMRRYFVADDPEPLDPVRVAA